MRKPNPCKPRIVALTLNGRTCHYAAPDDGRPLGDLTLGELRPYPALDAALALERIVADGRKRRNA